MQATKAWGALQLQLLRRTEPHLCFPLVRDQQVVGGEVSVHHIVAVHELHSCSSLAGQLQPQRPGAVQAEPWRSLHTTVTRFTTELHRGTADLLQDHCSQYRTAACTHRLEPQAMVDGCGSGHP